ncbi:MAG: universal stress protein [Burkholderiaceae bacterium]
MANILAPVQPGQDTEWSSQFLWQLHQRDRIRVHLLSVQPPYSAYVRSFFGNRQIHEIQERDAQAELEPMQRALDALGVPYNTHVVVGQPAEEIARFAQGHRCPQIVIGPSPAAGLTELVLGSLTRQVQLLMQQSGRLCEVL